MMTSNSTAPALDREHLASALSHSRMNSSRMARFLQNPIKNSAISVLRAAGQCRPVRCPTIFGADFHGFLPEAVTSLIWRYGLYEPETSLFLLDHLHASEVFLDIGAHFGYFSLLASTLVGDDGQVVSIEAMPTTYAALQNNIASNGRSNISAFQLAAGNDEGAVEFRDYGIVNSSLNTHIAARGILGEKHAAYTALTVQTQRMDKFFTENGLPRPNIVKIDAESSEHLVLMGMADLLSHETAPILLIEMGGGNADEDVRARQITEQLAAYGYRLFTYTGRRLSEISLKDQVPYFNGIFIPALRCAALRV